MNMGRLGMAVLFGLLVVCAYGDVSDLAWKAVLKRNVTIGKIDGSEVSGELSTFDATQAIVITADGEIVIVLRTDVQSVRVNTAASATQGKEAPVSAAPTTAVSAARATAAGAAPSTAAGAAAHLVVAFNPLGMILSSVLLGGPDFTADVQYAVTKWLALGVEPEAFLGTVKAFGAWGGALLFPLSAAPEGLSVKLYGGLGIMGHYIFPEFLASVGYQFVWGNFVFSPSIGIQYVEQIGLNWRLNIGFSM